MEAPEFDSRIQSLLKIGMIGLVQALPPLQLWSRAEMQIQTVNQYHHHVMKWLRFTLQIFCMLSIRRTLVYTVIKLFNWFVMNNSLTSDHV